MTTCRATPSAAFKNSLRRSCSGLPSTNLSRSKVCPFFLFFLLFDVSYLDALHAPPSVGLSACTSLTQRPYSFRHICLGLVGDYFVSGQRSLHNFRHRGDFSISPPISGKLPLNMRRRGDYLEYGGEIQKSPPTK